MNLLGIAFNVLYIAAYVGLFIYIGYVNILEKKGFHGLVRIKRMKRIAHLCIFGVMASMFIVLIIAAMQ